MTIVLVLLLILLLLCTAICSAAETALFSLSPLTIKSYKASNNPRLVLIARLMDHPRDILVTVMMLIILSSILVQNTVSSLFSGFGHWGFKIGLPLLLTLIFGEVLPKSYAMPNNGAVAYWVAPWIDRAARFFTPIRILMIRITTWFTRFFSLFFRKEKEISPDEFRHVLKSSEVTGVLLAQESNLISGLLDLHNSLCVERMRPRDEVLFYDIHEPLTSLIHLFVDLEITRIPVCDGNLDHLLGVLSTQAFFFHQENIKTPADLIPILKKPYYVPEKTIGSTLLVNLRERKEDLAIVVDEYGSISGLIAQEDLIEAVVGEIADRRDAMNLYTRSSEDVIIASGKLGLSTFRDIFGIPLKSSEHVVTLGGWLIEQLGDIPVTGSKYANDQFFFYILAADPNRIRRIYIRKL